MTRALAAVTAFLGLLVVLLGLGLVLVVHDVNANRERLDGRDARIRQLERQVRHLGGNPADSQRPRAPAPGPAVTVLVSPRPAASTPPPPRRGQRHGHQGDGGHRPGPRPSPAPSPPPSPPPRPCLVGIICLPKGTP